MRRSFLFVIAGTSALAVGLMLPSKSHAQRMFWGEDAWRASQPGVYIPYGGEPVVERYGYPPTPLFLWGEFGRQWWTQYEIDREVRYETFGTRYGPDHPPIFNRILNRRHRDH
jgi:hypothetical protein